MLSHTLGTYVASLLQITLQINVFLFELVLFVLCVYVLFRCFLFAFVLTWMVWDLSLSFPFAYDTFTHKIRTDSLACVDESVFLHVGFLVEPLPAVLTWVRPCVRVDEQVCRKCGRPLKTFTAYFAVKASFLKRKQIGGRLSHAFLSVNPPWLKKEEKEISLTTRCRDDV